MKSRISKMALFLALTAMSFALAAQASTVSEKCPDIQACVKVVSELTGQKYIYDGEVKGKVQASENLELTKENAELLFTSMLNMNGFTRMPTGQPNTYQILKQRDARDLPVPIVTASQKQAPALPNNWDLYTLKYKATNPEVVEGIARSSRSFMPANSRIIPATISGMLLITDTSMNLKKLYELIVDLDRKPTAEMKRRWAEEDRVRQAQRMRGRHQPGPGVPVTPTESTGP